MTFAKGIVPLHPSVSEIICFLPSIPSLSLSTDQPINELGITIL